MAADSLLGIIPGPGLLFGLILFAAIIGGYAARFVRAPRVVGFLLGGAGLRWLLVELMVTEGDPVSAERLAESARPLSAVTDLALGLILFTIGSVFERSKLRSGGRAMLKQSWTETICILLIVFVGCCTVAALSQPQFGLVNNLILGALLATAAIATAPAATLFVLQEYEAKGPITDRVLGLTGLNNVLCIVLFYLLFLALSYAGMIATQGTVSGRPGIALMLATLGSVALGVVAGTTIAVVHGKLPLPETLLFFFAFFILLGAGEQWLWTHQGMSYNFLLTALVTGAVFSNVAIDAQRLETTLRTVGSPIFAGFFVLAGYNLHIEELSNMGWLGVAYVLTRTAGKLYGCKLGARWTHESTRNMDRVGKALLCQAAVVIGLCAFVQRQWDHPLASQFAAVILGSIVVFELIGPLMVKRCVVSSGEVKAITLLRRSSATTEGASIVRVTLQSLRRFLGLEPRRRVDRTGPMSVEHIMRTNVHFLQASTTFDGVLHFIERSTYTHFPVVHEDGTFVGVIHFSDVRYVIYDPALCELITAVDLADPDSPTVPADLSLTDLFDVFTESNLTVLPVVEKVEHQRIVGLVEQRDLLRALHRSNAAR